MDRTLGNAIMIAIACITLMVITIALCGRIDSNKKAIEELTSKVAAMEVVNQEKGEEE